MSWYLPSVIARIVVDPVFAEREKGRDLYSTTRKLLKNQSLRESSRCITLSSSLARQSAWRAILADLNILKVASTAFLCACISIASRKDGGSKAYLRMRDLAQESGSKNLRRVNKK